MKDIHVPILIVGGGTVGLSTAAFLAHQGVPPLVVERRAGLSIHPRATGVSVRTQEAFRKLGVDGDLRAAAGSALTGGKVTVHTLADTDLATAPRAMSAKDFTAQLQNEVTPTTHTHTSQDHIDAVLHAAALRLGAEVRFGTTLESLSQNEHGVTATVSDSDGTYQIHAEHVVAADGVNSRVRQELGIGTTGPGPVGNENVSVLFRADIADLVQDNQFLLCEVQTPDAPGMLVSASGTNRWIFHTGVSVAEGREPADLVRTAIGLPEMEVEILSVMSWQANGRLAETFRLGRVFLAGDSAHAVPPLGATGMNSGIADAYNLAWKLAYVHSGRGGAGLLDSYEDERLPMGGLNLSQAMIRLENPQLHWDASEDAARKRLEVGLISPFVLSLGDRYASKVIMDPEPRLPSTQDLGAILDGAPGSRVPHVWLGENLSTVDLAGPDFALLTGVHAQPWRDAASAVDLKAHVVDAEQWLAPEGAMLVRPDGFIAWRHTESSDDAVGVLRAVLDRALGLTV